jgi:hypothetical protein
MQNVVMLSVVATIGMESFLGSMLQNFLVCIYNFSDKL